jgi:rhodanese-related sulfurtransferase
MPFTRSSQPTNAPLLAMIASLVCLSALGISCTRHAGKLVQMSANESYGMVRNDFAVLVDIRDAALQGDGVAQGAISMPSANIDETQLPKDKRIIVYGATSEDASKVANKLKDDGFDVGLMGAYSDWVQAKLPTQKR